MPARVRHPMMAISLKKSCPEDLCGARFVANVPHQDVAEKQVHKKESTGSAPYPSDAISRRIKSIFSHWRLDLHAAFGRDA